VAQVAMVLQRLPIKARTKFLDESKRKISFAAKRVQKNAKNITKQPSKRNCANKIHKKSIFAYMEFLTQAAMRYRIKK
jgi:hypothetical protein